MLSKEIRDMLRENEKYNKIFERYDETREFDLDKIRRSFTLRKSSYRKLKELSKTRGKPMSGIMDALIEKTKDA